MRIEGLKKTYGTRKVLDIPCIEFSSGISAIIGANGSGKSTFAHLVAGTECVDKDAVLRINWKDAVSANANAALFPNARSQEGGRIGFLPQKSYAFRMSLRRNVELSARNKQEKQRARQLIESLGLGDLENKAGNRLSGGETARMALARLLVRDYDLIVLDEPTSSTDEESTLVIERLIRQYVERTGACAIVITHELKQAVRVADALYFFAKGSLVECGETNEVIEHPRDARTRTFIDSYRI